MSDWRSWFRRKFSGMQGQAVRSFQAADAACGRQDYATALPLYEESLKQFRQLEQWEMVLFIRLRMGEAHRLSGDYPAARLQLEQAVSLARNQKHADYLEAALIWLASVAALQGETALAERLCAECLAMQPLPEKALEYAGTQCLLGMISKTMPEGRAHYECALEIYREKENQERVMICLCGLGHLTEPGQDNRQQRLRLQECLELCEVHGDAKTRSYALNNLGNIERFAGSFARAMELYRESLHLKQRLDDAWAISYTLDGCAAIAAAREQGAKAARLLGQASALRKRLGTPLEPHKQPEYEAILTQVRALLPPDEFEMAWEEGQRLSLDLAIREALEEEGA